jgi:peptidoglycan hydrolase CwlO-like protein
VEKQVSDKEIEIERKIKKRDSYKKTRDKLESEITAAKKELDNIKSELFLYYKSILKNGKDSR